jgi:hypothetical protein
MSAPKDEQKKRFPESPFTYTHTTVGEKVDIYKLKINHGIPAIYEDIFGFMSFFDFV